MGQALFIYGNRVYNGSVFDGYDVEKVVSIVDAGIFDITDHRISLNTMSATKVKSYKREFRSFISFADHCDDLGKLSDYDLDLFVCHLRTRKCIEFRNIVGDNLIKTEIVHTPSDLNIEKNCYLESFYQYFFRKCVHNLKNEDARCEELEKYATVFPFRINRRSDFFFTVVVEQFDPLFVEDIEKLVTESFPNVLSGRWLISFLFSNVHKIYKRFGKSFELHLSRFIETVSFRDDFTPDFTTTSKSEFSSTSIYKVMKFCRRPSTLGVFRLMNSRLTWNTINRTLVEDIPLPYKNENYYQFLPENNLAELFRLMDPLYYTCNVSSYQASLKKYLFFFGHAFECRHVNPVFYIDDVLYKALQYVGKFKTSRENLLSPSMEYVLWMMSIIHRRKSPNGEPVFRYPSMDRINLQNVINYIENIPGIESAQVNYSEPNHSLLDFSVCLLVKDTVYDITLSHSMSNYCVWGKFILKAALLYTEINKLVLYNPLSGIESSIKMPLGAIARIRSFVRKYNNQMPTDCSSFLLTGKDNFYETLAEPCRP